MLSRLSSRIVCACLFLVTSFLVTVIASPLIAMTDRRLEHQTLAKRDAQNNQVIRIGFQEPGSDTYERTFQLPSKGYSGLQLTIFFGSRGLKPRIVTPKDHNTPAKLEIVEVDAPRRQTTSRIGSLGALHYIRLTDIGPPELKTLWCDFGDKTGQDRAFEIMSNVKKLKAETNKLLQPARVPDAEVHDIEDDLAYINTCLLFLTLSRNGSGKPMVDSQQLHAGVWYNLYLQINRERGLQ
ncbi:hypothetical protein F5050DRAFT_418375 [Lentinula boryana]|uniref:Secreted protein n=1 Tax=Lentinula boryana TaxID=40481 RepID=A0ABQ8Q8L6_9AGAR|nr:hypothetical protein F5050DRAFT_418375 [Lentinula boryana]